MNEVFIIWMINHEGSSFLYEIYNTEEKAKQRLKKFNTDNKYTPFFKIQKKEVN